jgi:hypothetical protein
LVIQKWFGYPPDVSEEAAQMHKKRQLEWRRSGTRIYQAPDFVVTPEFFARWEHDVKEMLKIPRVFRAFIRSGRILWRLPMKFGDPRTIGPWPTEETCLFGIGTKFECGGDILWDDGLEDEEENRLLGVYYVRHKTESRDGSSLLPSLWPPNHAFDDSCYDYGCWTPRLEEFLNETDASYRQDDPRCPGQSLGQPKTTKEWKGRFCDGYSKDMRWASMAVNHQVDRFLLDIVDNPPANARISKRT